MIRKTKKMLWLENRSKEDNKQLAYQRKIILEEAKEYQKPNEKVNS